MEIELKNDFPKPEKISFLHFVWGRLLGDYSRTPLPQIRTFRSPDKKGNTFPEGRGRGEEKGAVNYFLCTAGEKFTKEERKGRGKENKCQPPQTFWGESAASFSLSGERDDFDFHSLRPSFCFLALSKAVVGRSVGRRASSVGDYCPRRWWRCQGPASPGACGGPGGGNRPIGLQRCCTVWRRLRPTAILYALSRTRWRQQEFVVEPAATYPEFN